MFYRFVFILNILLLLSVETGCTSSSNNGGDNALQGGSGGDESSLGGQGGNIVNCNNPQNEVCDDEDNDCDGRVDEGNVVGEGENCGTGELGACGIGSLSCLDGVLVCQQTQNPSEETCDGVDNDCDGTIDEANGGGIIERQCYSGPGGTDGVAACVSGTQECRGGQFDECAGEVIPEAETCDGVDNDCDGTIDENSIPADNLNCNTGLNGNCAQGRNVCQNGAIECEAIHRADFELCDDEDNDCDGTIDEGPFEGVDEQCDINSPGICARGENQCFGGVIQCFQTTFPGDQSEDCNNLDDDCDGSIDESPMGNQLFQACFDGDPEKIGVGICIEGIQTCENGQWQQCRNQTLPEDEQCDNNDNNCNGEIDESVSTSCYTGPAETEGVGRCRAGDSVFQRRSCRVMCEACGAASVSSPTEIAFCACR